MIRDKRGGEIGVDDTGFPSPSSLHLHPTAIRVKLQRDEMLIKKKKRQICARRRFEVEVGVRSIEDGGAKPELI
jgi:hypothetical protein